MAQRQKKGKEFEALAAWLTSCLHERAVITPNDKLLDRDTGEWRQIDISIRLEDGPTKFLGIVEARDKSRPVGVGYVEEAKQKKESVGANAVFIVSSKGFYKSALRKAEALGVGTYSYNKAISEDWSGIFQPREIIQHVCRQENPHITLLLGESNEILFPHESVAKEFAKDNRSKVVVDENGTPKASLLDLLNVALMQNHEHFFKGIAPGNAKERKASFVRVASDVPLFIKDTLGTLQRLTRFHFAADFWVEVLVSPVRFNCYQRANKGEVLAEVATTVVKGPEKNLKLEFVIKNPEKAKKEGTTLLLRVTPIKQLADAKRAKPDGNMKPTSANEPEVKQND